jgi:DNA-binding NarL/FixJ family response regulator
LFADDHRMVAHGIAESLSAWFDVVEIVTNPSEIGPAISQWRPEILLLDLIFDQHSALPMIPVVLKANRATRIVVLTGHATQQLADVAILAGAIGFVFKAAPADEVRTAIEEALAGRIYISRPVPDAGTVESPRALRITVTEIERMILDSLCLGDTQEKAAVTISKTVKDVEYHLARLRKQLGFNRTKQLLEWYRTWRRPPPKKKRN